mgnify:CR=1 FL=1
MPIIVLFYEENGLGLKDIFLLKSVYSIVLVSLDIPTGYLADAWGCIVAFGGYICYSLSSTFYAFFIAEILLGIGQSLVSGADSALLYDTMLHYDRENEYLKYEGKVTMIGNTILVNLVTCPGLYAIWIERSFFVVTTLITAGWMIGTSAM